MITLTGPQSTPEQRGSLAELSGLLDIPTTNDINWALVTELFRTQGWEACPIASADVLIAAGFGYPITDLPAA
ncbi:hypothetical protein [Streptomyces chryseus]|uniref:hypothetical protein n=1 Tax=Streptomyces chryseus TaxID=68186 RepID=UPI00110F8482|nr:hypothetical protein [Streptomyces chryseus]GGX26653.1 hypothetical protein GCM10010353_47140 [Streptomyces chryseus]